MIKRLSSLVLAGLLVLPTVAMAGDLEDRIDALEEQQETWDLSSRIQWNGDIRSRVDFHNATTAAYYKATDVGQGIYDFIDMAGSNGFADTAVLNNFGGLTTSSLVGDTVTGGTLLGNLAGFGLTLDGSAADKANFIGAATVAGLTDQQATDAYALFSDPVGNAMVAQFGAAGFTIGQLLGAMSTPENLAGMMQQLTPASRASIFSNMYNAYSPTAGTDYENDTLYTTRFRLNMRAKATENVEIKARLVGYKTWGLQDSFTPETNENGIHDTDSPYFLNSRSFDGTASRQPSDSILRIDRAFMNWNNIGDMPIWFSIGRRPVTDGPPAHIRMGTGKKMATPINYMDYPFDGLSLGYAYANLFGIEDLPGRIRFCYGRGFEAGPAPVDTGISDVDFGGISWDVFKKDDRFFGFQSFGAFNIFNVPGDTYFPNPLELAAVNQGLAAGTMYQDVATGAYVDTNGTATMADDFVAYNNTYLDRVNLGNIFHTSAVYMSKFQDLNYFMTLGWSHTDAKGTDEMGISLLSDFWQTPEDKDGYGVYLGVRYDLDDLGLMIGAEYNWGSENWLAFTPGHDDMYSSKLQTRGSVIELYTIYDLPSGDATSKFGKAFVRLGYQHFDYDYTYSGMWLGTPNKIDDIQNDPLMAQFYAPVDDMDQVYLTMEAWF
jgi:hypothetical protein